MLCKVASITSASSVWREGAMEDPTGTHRLDSYSLMEYTDGAETARLCADGKVISRLPNRAFQRCAGGLMRLLSVL